MKTHKGLLIIVILSTVSMMFNACSSSTQDADYPVIPVAYPDTQQGSQTDTYFGTEIADPYRWLEVDTAPEVIEWVKKQNEVTFGYLNQIPFRDIIRKRLEEVWNYPKFSAPFKRGDYYFFFKNDGLQNQSGGSEEPSNTFSVVHNHSAGYAAKHAE